MDLSKAVGAPFIRIVEGKVYEFPRLTMEQKGKLLARWRAVDRVVLKAVLVEVGASISLQATRLAEFDAARVQIGEGYNRCFEVESAKEIVGASTKLDTLPAVLLADETEMYMLAAQLWRLQLPEGTISKYNAESAEDNPDPLAQGLSERSQAPSVTTSTTQPA